MPPVTRGASRALAHDAARRIAPGGSDAISLASAAFTRADYDACRILLGVVAADRTTAAAAALLEARCARLQGDLDAWSAAAARAAKDHADPGARLEASALHALAALRLGNGGEAQSEFARLRKSFEADAPGAAGWAAYYLALEAGSRDDYDAAETYVARNIDGEVLVPESLSLLGWIEAKRERFRKAGAHYAEALRLSRASNEGDLRLQASMIRAASEVAAETVDLRMGRKLQQEADDFAWPQALQKDRFDALASLRTLAMLEGDLQRAWLLAREAAVCAPDPARRAVGEVNSAVVNRLLGNEASAQFQFERAWNVLRAQRPTAPSDELRVAYATFAAEAASSLPAEARKALAAGVALANKDERGDDGRDRRLAAIEAFAAGRVAEAHGHPDRATSAYERAFDVWAALKFDQRAAVVAFDLRRLAHDDRYDDCIDAVVARVPDAWFAAASPGSEILERLTPAETRVLGLLLEGKSARAIAGDLGRSVHTVNNHTRKVFKAFELTSRAAVLARCTELGITVQALRR